MTPPPLGKRKGCPQGWISPLSAYAETLFFRRWPLHSGKASPEASPPPIPFLAGTALRKVSSPWKEGIFSFFAANVPARNCMVIVPSSDFRQTPPSQPGCSFFRASPLRSHCSQPLLLLGVFLLDSNFFPVFPPLVYFSLFLSITGLTPFSESANFLHRSVQSGSLQSILPFFSSFPAT